MPTTNELVVALVDSFGEPMAIAELLTEDAVWWITPSVGVLPSPCTGRDDIVESMQVIFGDIYAEARAEMHMVIAEGDRASARFTLRAKMKIAGDAPYENEYCIWIERRGDRISRVWEYLDVAHASAQIAPEGEAQ